MAAKYVRLKKFSHTYCYGRSQTHYSQLHSICERDYMIHSLVPRLARGNEATRYIASFPGSRVGTRLHGIVLAGKKFMTFVVRVVYVTSHHKCSPAVVWYYGVQWKIKGQRCNY